AGYNGMKYYCVDGTAIANHMNGTAPENFLWMAICLGMATDGMESPLRERGEEVVYGYSQSVTFSGDYAWENCFWTKMKEGRDVKDAIAYMKQRIGIRDPYESYYPAYPIVVSSEDAYPGHGNVDRAQTVNSTWKLPALPTLYGDANRDGRITAADAALVLRVLVGCETLKPQGMKNAAVSGETELTAMDAVLILRRIVRLIDAFPVEE
ncbi:MAG: dockerin type I repeat-containing protein, partial [Clostridia bacterium]|nr:dockerin type I repeat-containing protein [Clostridia bacterium]